MANDRPKTSQSSPSATSGPSGSDDFAKFTRAIPQGALPDNILAQIITEPPSGPVPPVQTPGVEQLPPVAPGQPPLGGKPPSPEETALLSYRAMLRQEEARLAAIPKPAPMFAAAPAQTVIPTHFGAGAAELVIREGADPLHVECFKALRRFVVTGAAMQGGANPRETYALLERLRAAIEYAPKPVVAAS